MSNRFSPRHASITGGKSIKHLPKPRELMPQIKDLITELVKEDLVSHTKIAEKQITMKVLNMAGGFFMLDQESIKSLYHELKQKFSSPVEQATFRQIFFDTLIMGGSIENVRFFKEMALKDEEITPAHLTTLFMALPRYIIQPNSTTLHELFELVTSSKIAREKRVYSSAVMSFSLLINKACLAANRRTSYPTFVLGEFCHPDSEIVVDKWIPYLKNRLEHATSSWEKSLLVVSMGLMEHSRVIPTLMPLLEGRDRASPLTRFLALYSLSSAGLRNPQLVEPVAFAIFSNGAESTEMRVTAFNLLMKMDPSMTVFHKIAASTWQERDPEVLNVVNTAFYSLAYEQRELQPMITTSVSKSRKAWLVYPLIKKTPGRLPTSGTIFTSDYLPKLDAGYWTMSTWTASNDSVVPFEFYHKITYLLNQYKFSPFEFGLRFRGAETIGEEIVKLITADGNPEEMVEEEDDDSAVIPEKIAKNLSRELKKVMETLRVKARKSRGVEGLFWAKIMESAPYLTNFEVESGRVIRRKIAEVMRRPEAIKATLDGSSGINFQRSIDLAPVEVVIPSDMGLPIIVEVHLPIVISIRGDAKVEVNAKLPSISMAFKSIYATQLIGWVGTTCPFSGETVVTGVDQHSVINVPAKFVINVDVPQQKMVIAIKSDSSISSDVDVIHHHVRPFTAYKKFFSLKPVTLSDNIKYIDSSNPTRVVDLKFGQYLGLDLRSVISSQSSFQDVNGLVRRFSFFNYNPLNVFRFGWAPKGLSQNQMPSYRQHMFNLRFNPANSPTKEVEIDVRVGVATKQQAGEPAKYHAVKVNESPDSLLKKLLPFELVSKKLGEIEVHPRRQQKIKTALEKLGPVEAATGVSLSMSAIFKGSQQRAFHYSVNVASGYENMKQKWNLVLESEANSANKICIRGDVVMPLVPFWKINQIRSSNIAYHYNNLIGFGNDCHESQIKTTGTSRVSEEQKKYSEESPEAKQYNKMLSKDVPLAELSEVAEKVRRQASGIDQLDYTIEYKNVPAWVLSVNTRVIEYFKALLWPYYSASESELTELGVPQKSLSASWYSADKESTVENVQIRVFARNATFDASIKRPHASDSFVAFRGVPIPFPLSYFMPTSAVRSTANQVVEAVTGKGISPVCKLDGAWIRTFDNVTTSLKALDDCYHLLSGDCSSMKRFALLVRLLEPSIGAAKSPKELEALIGRYNVTVVPGRYHSKYSTELDVYVDGKLIPLRGDGKGRNIEDSQGHKIAYIKKSHDGVFSLSSTWVSFEFDGHKATVKPSALLKNKLCGLCGNANGQNVDDLSGPEQCIYSKPEIMVASYRVPPTTISARSCRPMPHELKQELTKENQECAKPKVIPTKVVKSFKAQTGRCTLHKHEILEKSSEICFSRVPVAKCSHACKPTEEQEPAIKQVSFTCLPKSRMAEHYAKKVRSGRILPELKNSPETFSLALRQPRHCVPVVKPY